MEPPGTAGAEGGSDDRSILGIRSVGAGIRAPGGPARTPAHHDVLGRSVGNERVEEDTLKTEPLSLPRREARSRRFRINNWVQDRPYVSWPLGMFGFLLPLLALASAPKWEAVFEPGSPALPLMVLLQLFATLVLMPFVWRAGRYPRYLATSTSQKYTRPGWDAGRMLAETGEVARILDGHMELVHGYAETVETYGTARERRRAARLVERAARGQRRIHYLAEGRDRPKRRRAAGEYTRNSRAVGAWTRAQREEHRTERTLIVLNRMAAGARARSPEAGAPRPVTSQPGVRPVPHGLDQSRAKASAMSTAEPRMMNSISTSSELGPPCLRSHSAPSRCISSRAGCTYSCTDWRRSSSGG